MDLKRKVSGTTSISKAQTFERSLQILSHFSSVGLHEILVAGIFRERERLYEKREVYRDEGEELANWEKVEK